MVRPSSRITSYTGAAVWGRTSKGQKATDPVRVEGAWPALVSKELFDEVQQAIMNDMANREARHRTGAAAPRNPGCPASGIGLRGRRPDA